MASKHPKLSIAIVCLMKENDDILPFWLEYHSALVGVESIVILDNYSKENSKAAQILREWQKKGLNVEWEQGPYSAKGELTFQAFQKYFPNVDIGIPLDIDEIVTGFKDGQPVPTRAAFYEGIDDFWIQSANCTSLTQYYTTCCSFVNDTVETINHALILTYENGMAKKMFRINSVKEIDHGNHHVLLKNGDSCVAGPLSLGLLHYHFRDPRLTLEHALADLQGFGYIDDGINAKNVHKYARFFKNLISLQLDAFHKAVEVLEFINHGYEALLHNCDNREDSVIISNTSTILRNL